MSYINMLKPLCAQRWPLDIDTASNDYSKLEWRSRFQMQQTPKSSMDWWALIHILSIFGQLSLSVLGAASFAFIMPSGFRPSDDDGAPSALSWVSMLVGALTTSANIYLTIMLGKTYSVHKRNHFTIQGNGFRDMVIFESIFVLLVLGTDLALAVKSGLSGQRALCAAASIGTVLSFSTVCADILRLLKYYEEKKKNDYVVELAQVHEETTAQFPEPPPPYEATAELEEVR